MWLSRVVIVFYLSVVPVLSQVGIGTESPELSAALDIVASDKGVLIPRVSLQSATDRITISGSLVDGLLVFNTSERNTMLAGFYYWYANSWHRIGNSSDSFLETITTLINNQNGTYTYTNEIGDITLIDIPSAVVNDLQFEGVIFDEINNIFDTTETLNFLHLQADGTTLTNNDK